MILVLAALFSFFGPPCTVDCCTCFTVLHYSYEQMNFRCCKLPNLPNLKSSSYADSDSGSRSVLPCHFVMKVQKCLYCLNCPKFGQLIFRKIIKNVATRCQIFRLKCTKFDFGWGSAPDPTGGAYSAPPTPLAAFKGPYF